jgi:putative ABC transport system permease protein
VLEKLKRLPGVRDVAMSTSLPLTGSSTYVPITLEGQAESQSADNPMVVFQQVTPGYHRAMGVPLMRGRWLSDFDSTNTPPAALVSEKLARTLWPHMDPIGKRILPADVLRPWQPQWLTVVGVVGDVRRESPAVEAAPDLYVSYRQVGTQVADFMARTAVDPLSLAAAATRVVAEVDREEPVSDLTSMDQAIARTIWQRRSAVAIITMLGAVALLLASIGIYSVIAYSVSQRTREMGIRTAVGATPAENVRLVLRQGAMMILPGLLIGALLALAATRFMQSMLFGIAALDARSYLLAIAVLTLVAFPACYLPARRASSIDPVIALRNE